MNKYKMYNYLMDGLYKGCERGHDNKVSYSALYIFADATSIILMTTYYSRFHSVIIPNTLNISGVATIDDFDNCKQFLSEIVETAIDPETYNPNLYMEPFKKLIKSTNKLPQVIYYYINECKKYILHNPISYTKDTYVLRRTHPVSANLALVDGSRFFYEDLMAAINNLTIDYTFTAIHSGSHCLYIQSNEKGFTTFTIIPPFRVAEAERRAGLYIA